VIVEEKVFRGRIRVHAIGFWLSILAVAVFNLPGFPIAGRAAA